MSDEKKYTERELVLAKRNAFVDGSYWGYNASQESAAKSVGVLGAWSRACADMASESAYPLPKVTRPRVVRDSVGMEFRFIAENEPPFVEWRNTLTEKKLWRVSAAGDGVAVNAERAKLWADLVANPTEEVEA